MSPKKTKAFRFPYVLIGIALIVAVFYRSPQGRGSSGGPSLQGGVENAITADPHQARPEVPSFAPVSSGVKPAVRLAEPVVSAPMACGVADLTKVSPPSIRKSTVPELQSRIGGERVPEAPERTNEKVYLPDSLVHAVPALPLVPDDIQSRGRAVPPLKIAIISKGNESVNQVALTFDDGPSNKHTPQILEILKQYQVKGTFFVLGQQVKENPEMLRRIADEGHEIGNHTYSHRQLTKLNEEDIRGELVSTQDEIRKVLGFAPKMMRPPYGAYRQSELPIFEQLGLNVVLWSVDTYDWRQRDSDAIARIVSRDTRNGSIILMHDIKSGTARVLPEIIQGLQSRGLKMVTVSELTGMPAYDYAVPVVKTDSPEPES